MLQLAPRLIRDLEQGAAVVLPSAQRAAAVRLAFAAHQVVEGRQAFRTPDIQPFPAWAARELVRARLRGEAAPRRLQAAEEWLLWRDAATAAAAAAGLPGGDQLAEPLRRAAAVLTEWCIPRESLTRAGGEEALLLSRALACAQAQALRAGAVAAHGLAAALQPCTPAVGTVFTGFDHRTPARAALMAAWRSRGRTVLESDPDFPAGAVAVAAAADADGETAMAAQWCREQLSEDPTRRLLVILPDLHQRPAAVGRIFEQVLSPGGLLGLADAPAAVPLWASEGGRPLTEHALVVQLLLTLRLCCEGLAWPQFSAWLRQGGRPGVQHREPDGAARTGAPPGPGEAERARLEVWLRRLLPVHVVPAQLLQTLQAPGAPAGAGALAAQVRGLLEAVPPGAVPLPQWARRFAAALAGGAGLSSAQLQVRARFEQLLGECARLARSDALGAAQALETVTALTRSTYFEPATGDPAVTLSAVLGDPAVRYDGIWVAGLTAGAWPRPPSPDPFIPLAEQRRAGLPWVDAQRALQLARATLAALARSTRELILSWPAQGEDEQLPSPLLAGLPAARPRVSLPLAAALRRQATETFEDPAGLAWPAERPLPAGTRAVELQSRCGFRAYAELRLHAAALETPQPGIAPAERGQLLHRALELLWAGLGSSQALAAARAEGTLAELIRRAVFEASALLPQPQLPHPPQPPQSPQPLPLPAAGWPALRRAAIVRERARAERLIARLCALELTRPAFEVSALEAPRRLSLGGALLDVRIDRIDRSADGHLIFDYKTGQPLRPDWLAERSTHPQLLLYLFAAGVPVAGMAVVHLTPQQVVYRGIADRADRLPGVEALEGDWEDQVRAWEAQLARLIRGFLAGAAAVDPAEDACRYCHLHSFCRIAELAGAAEEAE